MSVHPSPIMLPRDTLKWCKGRAKRPLFKRGRGNFWLFVFSTFALCRLGGPGTCYPGREAPGGRNESVVSGHARRVVSRQKKNRTVARRTARNSSEVQDRGSGSAGAASISTPVIEHTGVSGNWRLSCRVIRRFSQIIFVYASICACP